MATIPLPKTNLKETTVEAVTSVISSAAIPPPKKNDEYRFYQCHLEWNGLKCQKVNSPQTIPIRDDSLLLSVKSYIPELFNSYILKYELIPSSVFIEKST